MVTLGRTSGKGRARFSRWAGFHLLPVLVPVFCLIPITTLAEALDILGVRLGMTRASLQETLSKSRIPISELEAFKIAVPRLPVSLEGVREVRLSFENDMLGKIVIEFEIPTYEPAANKLIGKYEAEKERLKQLFGAPADDRANLNPPKAEERYQWLARGRGYCRTMWKTPEKRITLWLYGEDEGPIFQEIYESQ